MANITTVTLAKSDTLYQPLYYDEIRIAYLLPGPPGTMVRMHLSSGRLDRRFTQYRAVSYTWGDPTDTVPITVDGHAFQATRNLHELLVMLRTYQPTSAQPLWIDAICLNQLDDIEKAKQVPRMADIYSMAEDVILWLGINSAEEDEAIGEAFASLNELNELALTTHIRDLTDWLRGLEASHPALHHKLEATLHVVERLDKRPWFTRAWIVQEAALAGSRAVMHAGRHSTSLKALELFSGTFKLSRQPLLSVPRITSMLGTRLWYFHLTEGQGTTDYGPNWDPHGWHGYHDLYWEALSHPTTTTVTKMRTTFSDLLVQLLLRTCGVHCYLPQDRIYALWGMVRKMHKDDVSAELLPSYSTPWHKVYHVYARHLIEGTADLRLLVCRRRELPAHVPSWVPDFRYLGSSSLVPRSLPTGRIGCSKDGMVLEGLKGVRLGQCVAVVPPCDGEAEKEGHFRAVVRDLLLPRSNMLGTPLVDSFEAFQWVAERSLSLSFMFDEKIEDGDGEGEDADVDQPGGGEGASSIGAGGEEEEEEPGDLPVSTAMDRRTAAEFETIKKWGMLLVSDGTLGVLIRQDAAVHAGDVVVAFKGAAFPMILRPTVDAAAATATATTTRLEKCFELVGGCCLAYSTRLTEESFFAGKTLEGFNLV